MPATDPLSQAPQTVAVKATFPGSAGHELAARLDLPIGPARAYALFAHCFTCTKDVIAARTIAARLAKMGIAVLRFDFTGLGASEGEFANTDFTSNVEDLIRASDWLRSNYVAPSILIGHSLGGAAVLAAAESIPESRAIVTIGAPADTAHVLHNLGCALDTIRAVGEAEVRIAGRPFKIRRSFVEDVESHRMEGKIARLGKALLVMHAPRDEIVGVDNATRIFVAAKHPKSFVSLDDADHLVSRPADAEYAAGVISAWVSRYIDQADLPADGPAAPLVRDSAPAPDAVVVAETGAGRFQCTVVAGRHRLVADEPAAVGGLDSGPGPYDFLSIALGACTAMTLRLYAEHKKLDLPPVSIEVRHGKVAADHCTDCGEVVAGRTGKIDRFERIISVAGPIPSALADRLVEIAGKCPVHRTLEASSVVVTKLQTDAAQQ